MTDDTITINSTREATDIMSTHLHPCPICQRMTSWFRNLHGRTRCITCAQQEGAHAC